ncbi:restriction endonuclease subunit S [Desulfococcus sp.]|uniref:restriction endonuclease subunit S n=1 Tax=Desulfococcus sp. TaxID=2025834 RepID=UPI00359307D9
MNASPLSAIVEEWGGLIQTGPFGSQLHQHDYSEEGIPVVMPKDIRNGRVDESGIARIPENKASQLSRHLLKAGSVVFPRRGEISKCAYINEEQAGFLCGTGCIKIEPPEERLRSKFLFYYLGLRHSIEWLERNAVGTTMLNLNTKILGGLKISLLPTKKQDEIVDVLSAYDDLIENNRRRIQLLEQAARLLYKEWFVRLRFPGHEHVKIVDGVPEGWERKPLREIADITMGQSPKSIYYNKDSKGLPFHQGVTNFGIRFPSHETYCTELNRLADPSDILFSVRAPVGRINITPDKIVIGRGLAAIRSNRGQQNLLFYALKSHFFKEDMMGGGAIFAAITKKDLYGVELLQAPDRTAGMFMEHVLPIDLQIDNLQKAIGGLTQARDLLLPRLMNGEVAV